MTEGNRNPVERLSAARLDYQRDMKWVRDRFGIIPELRFYQVNETLMKALDAIVEGTEEASGEVVRSFKELHRDVMREIVWHMLEQCKKTLMQLEGTDPELFMEKVKLWNRASWLFTNFSVKRSPSVGGNYRKALKLLSEL